MKRILSLGLLLVSTTAFAQSNSVVFVQSVPALDEIGVAGLIVLVGAIGGWIARRRK
ncbi:MAG: hypothetical protein ABI886_12840 [Betaproteobacteria bacterium]